MRELMKRSVALILAFVICVGMMPSLTIVGEAANYIYNWGKRGEVATAPSDYADAFYTGSYTYDVLSSLSGGTSESNVPNSELYKALHTLMESKHSYQTSYDATRDKFQYTDCQNGGGKISSFYSGKLVGPSWDGGSTWNREHSWPNSKGDASGNGENDIMMLRPASVSENSSRGNKAYGESSGYYDPNSESGGAYNLHGDVARIVLYVYVRWECKNTGSYNPNGIFGTGGVMESLDVLLEWMEEDPVDTWELGRNDAVQSITGTRNVFVDYPELAFLLFGEEIPAGLTTPSGEGANKCDHNNFKEVVTAPTCTAPGYTTYTCQVAGCGYSKKSDNTAATGHSFADGACSVCGAEEPDTMYIYYPAGGNYVSATASGNRLAPSTSPFAWDVEQDSNGYYIFSVDGQYMTSGETGNSLSLSGSLTDCGRWEVITCNGGVYLRNIGAQYNETYNQYLEYYSNTFTTYGFKEENSSLFVYQLLTTTACTHANKETIPAKAATCNATGLTEGQKCKDCGLVLTAQTQIPATGAHNYVNGTCNVCGAQASTSTGTKVDFSDKANRKEFTTSKQVWEQNGITVTNNKDKSTSNVADYANPARFYKSSQLIIAYPGMTKIVFNCNTTSYATDLKTSIGTVSGATVTVNGKAVTVEFASAVNSFTISLTGGQVRMDSLEVSTGNGGSGGTTEHQHSYTSVVTAPTCTAGGYTTYTCGCGHSYTGNAVNALGHKLNSVAKVEATCTADGMQAHDKCSACNKLFVNGAEKTEADLKIKAGHKLNSVAKVEATCTADGMQAHDKCSACNKLFVNGVEKTVADLKIKATGHSHNPVVTAPTCTAGGYTTYTCGCGHSYTGNAVNALGHAWDAGVVTQAPTEAKEGQRKYTCTRCGETKVESIPALGHTHNYTPVVTAPTCTAGGYTTYACSCGLSYVDSRVDALGHAWDAGVVTQEPTEQKEGQRKYTCTRCGETKVESIPALGHTHSYTPAVTGPTCTAGGYTTYTCGCGHSYTGNAVNALGHSYGQWYEAKAPTCLEAGEKRHDCANCDHFESQSMAALNHSFTNYVSDKNATTEADGTKTATCDHGCGKTHTVVDEGSKITQSDITSDVYEITDGYIGKISHSTTVEGLMAGLHNNANVEVYRDGKPVEADAVLGTGMVIRRVVGGQVVAEAVVVVTGDTSGDGKITITDMLAVKAHLLQKGTLDGAAGQAADVSGDSGISITDFLQLKAHILGKSEIKG